MVTGGHCSEQKGTDNIGLEFLYLLEGPAASLCQVPCRHVATGPGVLLCSRRGDLGRIQYVGVQVMEGVESTRCLNTLEHVLGASGTP